jgi:microcystin-dependent protein
VGIFDAPTVGVINGDWLSHLFGVLDVLADPSAWDGDDATQHAAGQQIEQFLTWLLTASEAAPVNIGDIGISASATLPDTRLWCDGATYNRADYPDLYAALDAAFLIDADTFQVPDLRERVPVGESASYTVGAAGGAAEHTLTAPEIPPLPLHVRIYTPAHAAGTGVQGQYGSAGTGANPVVVNMSGGEPHNNMQPYLVVRYWIQAK